MQETQSIVSDPLARPIILKKKVPKNSMILSKNNYASINNNILCLGDIGSGKTRNVINSNIDKKLISYRKSKKGINLNIFISSNKYIIQWSEGINDFKKYLMEE